MQGGVSFDEQLPYFVYGTLRPTFGNSYVWRWNDATAVDDGQVVARGFEMWGGGIPYAVPTDDPDSEIVGCLIIPPDNQDDAKHLRLAMDALEGHPNHYERRLIEYHRRGESQPAGLAWIYAFYNRSGRRVESGDYADALR